MKKEGLAILVEDSPINSTSLPDDVENFGNKRKLLGTWAEFKLCGQYYRRNLKSFLGVQCIPFIAVSLVDLYFLYVNSVSYFLYTYDILLIPALIIVFSFFGSTFGLAYDVLSSGDEFSEFKGFIHYFKAHWWRFIAIGVLLVIFPILVESLFINTFLYSGILSPLGTYLEDLFSALFSYGPLGLVPEGFISWVLIAIFLPLFPSVVAQGSLRYSMAENWSILKHHILKLVKIFALLFLFMIPILVLRWVLGPQVYVVVQDMSGNIWIPNLVEIITLELVRNGIYFLVVLPLLSLMVTRIYNADYFK